MISKTLLKQVEGITENGTKEQRQAAMEYLLRMIDVASRSNQRKMIKQLHSMIEKLKARDIV